MKIWLDAQLSPTLAEWISGNFDVKCQALRDLGLRDAEDNKIFEEALQKNAIVMTKDSDFANLASQKDKSPQIIWVTV